MTLLKNDGILPLSPKKTTALIGPLADEPNAMLSGYTFPVHLSYQQPDHPQSGSARTLREAFARRLGRDTVALQPGVRHSQSAAAADPRLPRRHSGGADGADRHREL